MKSTFSCMIMVCLLILTANSINAQEYQFSQNYSSPTILSPAFAGISGGSRLCTNYRNQWPAIPGTFLTYAVSYDTYIPKITSGLGFTILRDVAGKGNLSLTNFGAMYSKTIFWRGITFRSGFNFMYSRRAIDFPSLLLGDQLKLNGANAATTIDPDARNSIDHIGYFDMSAGTLMHYDDMWFGINIDHLLTPNQSLTGNESLVPIKFTVLGGKSINLTNRRDRHNNQLAFTFLYKKQADFHQLDFGTYWTYDPIVLGLWLRGMPFNQPTVEKEYFDAVVMLIGYKLPKLSFAYSYDLTISKLLNNTGGSHEVSVIYDFNTDIDLSLSRRFKAIQCPRF